MKVICRRSLLYYYSIFLSFRTQVFSVNFVNYSRTPILKDFERLVLKHQCAFLGTSFLQNISNVEVCLQRSRDYRL